MIQSNLLFACLVSMAVGGNTATAFHKEPQQATSETTITENYAVNIAEKRELINSFDDPRSNDIELHRKIYRYIDSQNNYLIQGNTYRFDEDWYDKDIEENEVYTTSMNITILKCVPYYNVKLDNSTFNFIVNGYWQSNALNAYPELYITAKAILWNQTTNLDNYLALQTVSKQQCINMYSALNNFNANYVLNTNTIHRSSFIDADEQGEPSWDNIPISITVNQYNLNARTPFYIVLISEVILSGTDEGYPRLVSYGSSINNPTGILYFNESWTEGSTSPITVEPVPIADMMYTIMTMPFSFISQAFNLTLFPNTPYEINISSIMLLLLTILIVMFITRIVMKFMR